MTRTRDGRVYLIFAIAVAATRAVAFGHAFTGFDEQFYLLVGDRMWAGAVPFVDIWDRKPVGLFLIFAAIRGLGGNGIVQYQLVAGLFLLATACLAYRFVRPTVGAGAAIWASLAIIVWPNLAGGEGGQSPIFYNLPMLGAAMLTARAWEQPDRARKLGAAAMALTGVALQIKYSAIFEGVFFGMSLLWVSIKARRPWSRLAIDALLWVGLALLPTVLAAAWYWRIGHIEDFLFANFLSVTARGSDDSALVVRRFAVLCAILAPLLILTALGWREKGRHLFFIRAWLLAAVAGVLIFGTFFDHYALPVIVPAAFAASAALKRGKAWRTAAYALLLLIFTTGQFLVWNQLRRRGNDAVVARLVAATAHSRNCPWLYDSQPAVTLLGHHCLVSRWVDPAHINQATERNVMGMDTAAEARRILSRRPDVIVTRIEGFARENRESRAIVDATLARDYVLAERIPAVGRTYGVYRLRAGLTPLPNAWPIASAIRATPAPSIQPASTSLGQ